MLISFTKRQVAKGTSPLARYYSSFKRRVLIQTDELENLMRTDPERLTIINSTVELAPEKAIQDHKKGRIPGSISFRVPEISDPNNEVSLMLPSEEQFSRQMKELGVRKSDIIVCYDKKSMHAAPRSYFMMKTYGAPYVYILDGTFKKWEAENRPVETDDAPGAWKRERASQPDIGDFDYHLIKSRVASLQDIEKMGEQNKKTENYAKILDARFKELFNKGQIPTS